MRKIKEVSDPHCNATVFQDRMTHTHDPNSLFERESVRSVDRRKLQFSNQLVRSVKLTKTADVGCIHNFEILIRNNISVNAYAIKP